LTAYNPWSHDFKNKKLLKTHFTGCPLCLAESWLDQGFQTLLIETQNAFARNLDESIVATKGAMKSNTSNKLHEVNRVVSFLGKNIPCNKVIWRLKERILLYIVGIYHSSS